MKQLTQLVNFSGIICVIFMTFSHPLCISQSVYMTTRQAAQKLQDRALEVIFIMRCPI